ncbi:sensor histidine kinase [Crenobacter cavernae]|uniref:histidine kinase n=1 Tax=Crenobacter cavernae TaxID=2290923 RepID=A0A345Y9P2_9NEIS|nr:ATP-binding protein [Crenobacter cavernae]AXK40644.1 GHKL domain-containing protein [Crenobacter cavernae]
MSRQLQLVLLWVFIQAVFAGLMMGNRLDALELQFEQDARIAHRLLSQEAVELDAVLNTLVAAHPRADTPEALERLDAQLAAIYPQIADIAFSLPGRGWRLSSGRAAPSELAEAYAKSATLSRSVMTRFSGRPARYWLVRTRDDGAAYALWLDPARFVAGNEWPNTLKPVLLRDGHGTIPLVQAGPDAPLAVRLVLTRNLASVSQPMLMQAETRILPKQLPWATVASLALATGFILWGLNAFLDQRQTVLRARRQARFVQVARLNTLGEMAAGMAHELNQPLTSILANCQASLRVLDDEEPDTALIREALSLSVTQAKRAGEIIARLREDVLRPREARRTQILALAQVVDETVFLVEPECRKREVRVKFNRRDDSLFVRADRVALEQVIHNLLSNALEAMRDTPPERRLIELAVVSRGKEVMLTVSDRGPGIPPEVLPRLFEPFFTTRQTGMGLGLSICETLIGEMGGVVAADNRAVGGARFVVTLPRVETKEDRYHGSLPDHLSG